MTEDEFLEREPESPIEDANFKVPLWQLRAKGVTEESQADRWCVTEKGRSVSGPSRHP